MTETNENAETYVPSDFEFLDPDRPDVRYESDLSPEERAQMASQIEGQEALAASGKKLGPPYSMTLPDGEEIAYGGDEQS